MTKEQVIKERFPNSKIYKLDAEQIRTKKEKMRDSVSAILSKAPAGMFKMKEVLHEASHDFYLIQHDLHYYLASLSGDTIISEPIDESIIAEKFECGGWRFINIGLI